ncbi:MAG: DUF2817 domain-containing protein [Deltaproteobacteria bacterium]|nr:DUF2817 domain-containing protein [Deltaproteobacteria bacterium]
MRRFIELSRIERLGSAHPDLIELRELATVSERGRVFPVHGLIIGSKDQSRPTLGLFGGVHGLERVGTHVVLSFLEMLAARIHWDRDTRHALSKTRIVSIPMINPCGIYFHHRPNANGVDLMRNAPVEAESHVPPLVGGQRISPRLPWFRGWGPLEIESAALIDFVRQQVFPARASLTLDMHSGFGMQDRLWYPYAKSTKVFSRIDQVSRLIDLLDRTYPHHIYRVEQQSDSYCTNGDLWDYIYELHEAREDARTRTFLPWTLEIGSWRWVRKNPLQLLRVLGPFNPIKPHRYSRTMRRHLILIDFFWKAVRNYERWSGAE